LSGSTRKWIEQYGAEQSGLSRHRLRAPFVDHRPREKEVVGSVGPKRGAANRTRTCDPVITNDVLYQLSYCGGPDGAFRSGLKTLAPDIGQHAILQEKRGPARG
jgi:hypothetical protein